MPADPFNFVIILLPLFFGIPFVIIIGVIIYSIVKGIKRNHKNNQSPVLTVEAVVTAKRTDVTHHHNHGANNMNYMNSTTWYYVTFQVESGSRFELPVEGTDFGMLAEGDRGKLTFQGTRYLGFQRYMG